MTQEEAIRAYIQQCYPGYTREAITRSLRDQGHAQDIIDRVWQSYFVEATNTARTTPFVRGARWMLSTLIGIGLFLVVTAYLLLCDSVIMSILPYRDDQTSATLSQAGGGLNLLFFLSEIGVLIGVTYYRWHGLTQSAANRFLLIFNLGWFLTIAGSCVVASQ